MSWWKVSHDKCLDGKCLDCKCPGGKCPEAIVGMVNGWVVIIPGVSVIVVIIPINNFLGGMCPGDGCLSDKGPRGKYLDC